MENTIFFEVKSFNIKQPFLNTELLTAFMVFHKAASVGRPTDNSKIVDCLKMDTLFNDDSLSSECLRPSDPQGMQLHFELAISSDSATIWSTFAGAKLDFAHPYNSQNQGKVNLQLGCQPCSISAVCLHINEVWCMYLEKKPSHKLGEKKTCCQHAISIKHLQPSKSRWYLTPSRMLLLNSS